MLIYSFMYQNKKDGTAALLHIFFFLVQIFTVLMNRKCLKKVQKKCLLTYCLLYPFFLPYKICCGDFFLRQLSLMSAVFKFSLLVENLHTVM